MIESVCDAERKGVPLTSSNRYALKQIASTDYGVLAIQSSLRMGEW